MTGQPRTTPYPLGRHQNHDPRNRDFPFRAERVTWSSVRHSRILPVTDQGDLGSCTGHAGIGAVGTVPVWDSVPSGERGRIAYDPGAAAVDLYSRATRIDPFDGRYPPTDTGSDGTSTAKVLKALGIIGEYRWTFSLNDALKALTEYPVMLGVPWYDSMFYPDSAGNVRIEPDAIKMGGHEICADEIDTVNCRVGFTNSWGTGWGNDGRGYITFADLGRLLDEGGDVCVPIPARSTRKPSWWTRVKLWLGIA